MEKTIETREEGIFALQDFEEDEVIEYFPILSLSNRARYHSDEVINHYGFTPDCNCEECKNHGSIISIFLGHVTLANHSDDPSARIYQPSREEGTLYANRLIRKGEEITIYSEKRNTNKVEAYQESEETFENFQTETAPEPEVE